MSAHLELYPEGTLLRARRDLLVFSTRERSECHTLKKGTTAIVLGDPVILPEVTYLRILAGGSICQIDITAVHTSWSKLSH
jgi:hypothetical protein